MLKNLDVTLRDGGYRNQFSFSLDYIIEHIKNLTAAQVEYIEIGYRKGSFKPMNNVGQTALCSNDYIQRLHNAIPDAKLVIIAHPHNINQSDIRELKDFGVTLLRLCLNKNDIESTFALCSYARSLGLSTSINITRVSQIDENYLRSIAIEAGHCGASILYLADSNGSLLPENVTYFVQKIKDISPLEIGFHAHDNLDMAMANSITAVEAGASFIDSSLMGMRKGAGNLTLEP
ncbi:3-hydroxy-3-methylglutaryl-CoA lyase [Bartonella refiksaydamii]|uniref:3-hydroxy-3-methylglutaryl-CoA lyase n=1 Tax=Bartonella refiksaydamii TaxID=2654951 RepID=UPI0012EC0692|nr:3-hydroxy-3-methylglutaryl-CoA lyase [Bartonella refiksaydamii]